MAGIVQSLNAEWAHVARSPPARRALMRWASANPVLAEARSVDEFVDTRSSPAWGEAAQRVLAAETPNDSIAARTLLQPGSTDLARWRGLRAGSSLRGV